MFKNILVPVDGSNYQISQVNHAIELARIYNAKITALFVVDIKIVEGPMLRDLSFLSETLTNFEYHNEVKNSLEEKGAAALEKIKEICAAGNISCECRVVPGIIANTIAETAKLADIIILGKRGENANFGGEFLGSSAENATRLSNKPVMVVEENYRAIKKMMFAYDGSASANKALQVVADLTLAAKLELSVITVYDDETEGKQILSEAVSYLNSYNITPAEILKSGDVVDTIISEANETGSDLIMMGAYGHSAFQQMLLGSTTTLLIRAARMPVLLYR